MRVAGFNVVGHLNIVLFGAPDDFLLLGYGQIIPRRHIVNILLHELVAAASILWVFVTDHAKVFTGCGSMRIFRTVHKTDDGTPIPVAETVHFYNSFGNITQSIGDDCGNIVGDAALSCPHMKVQISRS